MKTYNLDEVLEKIIGKLGTLHRDRFENELQMDLIGNAIKQTRRERDLTQEELGKLIGVQKAQISRLESNAGNVTIDTIMLIFAALKAKVRFQVEMIDLNKSKIYLLNINLSNTQSLLCISILNLLISLIN